jgi:excisionase family DNA binding protein
MLQNVKNMSQNVAEKSQGVVSMSQNVSEMSQNVAGYLTTVEVAHALGIARRSLNDWINDGKIKAVKVKGKNFIPKQEAFKFIFRNVFNRSSSINEFKEALKKVIPLSDDEINNTLLELDKEGVLSLKKRDELDFITWMKK